MKKNQIIRSHLRDTAQVIRSKNCFRFGAVEIKIDHDSPVDGVKFIEHITVSIYNAQTDTDMVLSLPISNVIIVNNALGS